MEQQLLQDIIEIKPTTMNDILPKITQILSTSYKNSQVVQNIIKSIFYGLWNFDKMINQHNLSTAIAEMVGKLPQEAGFIFLRGIFEYIHQKYNLIDKHRINKFMQLIRYLLKKGLEISQKKTNKMLQQIIFNDLSLRIGIAYHIVEIYFETFCEIFTKNKTNNKKSANKCIPIKSLAIFEDLLQRQNSLEHFRLHIIEYVYEKYKHHIVQVFLDQPEQMQTHLQQIIQHFMQLAQEQTKDHHRKNLYLLVGYMKSDQVNFKYYLQEKQQKAQKQKVKHIKKLSKHKKKIIKQAKAKRKQENKKKKKSKVMSKGKLQMAAEQYH